jgi:hypothetical protein
VILIALYEVLTLVLSPSTGFFVTIRALLYCFLLRLTGSLWLGIGFHAAWDWAQSFLYGTPQSGHVMQGHLFSTHALGAPLMSGGVVGSEGSLLWAPPFVLGLLVFFWALNVLVYSWRHHGPPGCWGRPKIDPLLRVVP